MNGIAFDAWSKDRGKNLPMAAQMLTRAWPDIWPPCNKDLKSALYTSNIGTYQGQKPLVAKAQGCRLVSSQGQRRMALGYKSHVRIDANSVNLVLLGNAQLNVPVPKGLCGPMTAPTQLQPLTAGRPATFEDHFSPWASRYIEGLYISEPHDM